MKKVFTWRAKPELVVKDAHKSVSSEGSLWSALKESNSSWS